MAKVVVSCFLIINFYAVILITCTSAVFDINFQQSIENVESQFRDFIYKYNKSYAIGSEEYFRRFLIFKSNLELHAKLNSLNDHLPGSAFYGVTKFSDMTQEEFKQKFLSGLDTQTSSTARVPRSVLPLKASTDPFLRFKPTAIPKIFDWRTAGIITEPRDQKDCGACWAFASVETIESMHAKRKTKLTPLSVQQMIDCSFNYFSVLGGCKGGNHCYGLCWALQTGTTFVPEVAYPFADQLQTCQVQANRTGPFVTNLTCNSFVNAESFLLKMIVSIGPLAVSVDASNWNNYQGGVIQFHCGEVGVNHVVQIVGYDLTAPVPYYIIKNSWGTDFGHGGYVYVKYGGNVCKIAEQVASVEVLESSDKMSQKMSYRRPFC